MAKAMITRLDGQVLIFDSVVSEQWAQEIALADHPVDVGSPVTDHAQALPQEFTLDGIVTESPYATSPPGPPGPARTDLALRFLESSAGQLLVVTTTKQGTVPNCMLRRYAFPVTRKGQLRVSVTFRRVAIAVGTSVLIPPRVPAPTAQTGAPSSVDAGVQPPAPAVAAPADVSLLAGVLSALTG